MAKTVYRSNHCSENHVEHGKAMCGQSVEFLNVAVGGTFTYHYVLQG
jgi:hypothetical protein